MKTTLVELIKSLECSLEVKKQCDKYCPYLLKEEIPADMIGQVPIHDIEEDGKQYWYSCDCDGMVKDAIETLKKLIPQRANYSGNGYYNGELVIDTWECPCCGTQYEVDYDDYEYCPKCGQHIDHSTLTEDD